MSIKEQLNDLTWLLSVTTKGTPEYTEILKNIIQLKKQQF